MDFFVNPWFMAAGGALISSPILIHLINRMRYKRVRWAAMEFLLKSQKKNRRRLIIEQLILLLLRILLVLLAAFLLARYLYSGSEDEGGTKHFVVLDTGLSMTDHWKEEGNTVNSFDKAKEEVVRVVEATARANSAQEMVIYTLDNLDTPVWEGRLNTSTSGEEVRQKLAEVKPTALHLAPSTGITRGTEYLKTVPQRQKMLHYIGDFRENKWVTGAEGERTTKSIDDTLAAGIDISLLDVAAPKRSVTKGVANNHDNLAITDLHAESRIVAEGVPVEFTVTLHNYGTGERKTHLKIYVNGAEDFNGSKDTDKIAPNGSRQEKFSLVLTKKKPAQDIRFNDAPDVREQKRRAEQEFVRVSAEIDNEETGLQADNYRDMIVEVRKKVPALLIDGNDGGEGQAPGGDVFFLEIAMLAAKAYDIERRTVDDLDKINLDLYPSIYLLNVREIKSDKALEKLKDYVQRGGSLAYFLGPKTFVPFYNEKLHKELKGLFPVLLEPNPVPALTDEERLNRQKNDHQPKIIFRMPATQAEKAKETISSSDPASIIVNLAKEQTALRALMIERYFRAQPSFQWDTDKNEKVEQLIMLPNRNGVEAYSRQAQDMMKSALELSRDLADNKDDFKKYARAINDYYRPQVTRALGNTSGQLFDLAIALDRMLNDPLPKQFLDNPDEPKDMKNIWAQPTMVALGERIRELIETVKYGDPLVVARPYGKGRIVACFTPAGTLSKWNDWAGGSQDSWSYPMFVMDLQRYLTSGGADVNKLVGEQIEFNVDAARYSKDIKVAKLLLPEVGEKPKKDENETRKDPKSDAPIQMKEIVQESGNQYAFTVKETKRPGMYFYTLSQQPGDVPEDRAYAFNVDPSESDLRRAQREKLERQAAGQTASSNKGKIVLREMGDDLTPLAPPHPDASESPWLYLLILVILVVEQALAVHLSFHLRGSDNTPPQPAVAPAAA